MAYDEGLAERIREHLRDHADIREQRMFGGVVFMWRGHMLAGITGDALMARVGPDQYAAAVRAPHARAMEMTGRLMKGFVLVAPAGYATDAALAQWLGRCEGFVGTLPPK